MGIRRRVGRKKYPEPCSGVSEGTAFASPRVTNVGHVCMVWIGVGSCLLDALVSEVDVMAVMTDGLGKAVAAAISWPFIVSGSVPTILSYAAEPVASSLFVGQIGKRRWVAEGSQNTMISPPTPPSSYICLGETHVRALSLFRTKAEEVDPTSDLRHQSSSVCSSKL